MNTQITFILPPGPLQVGLIEADGVRVGPSRPEYVARIDQEIASILAPGWIYPDSLQKGIRRMLKAYGFHPSGRNRPASEFLVKDLLARGAFNPISNVVDINNHLSLLSHLPISILDREKSGERLSMRVGVEPEQYVFNREGQTLTLRDLLLIARDEGKREPMGSPVKDSQATKVFEDTSQVVGIVYSSYPLVPTEALAELLQRFGQLLKSETAATRVEWQILDAPR